VLNAHLREAGPFSDIWVQPAAGDAGTALGAALWVDAGEQGAATRRWNMDHAFLGPAFSDDTIEQLLRESKLAYRRPPDIVDACAGLLAQDQVLGWFQGRMEFGPRALGARSILASPLHADMQERLNQIKDREDFRPVAPAVPEEACADWFVDGRRSPFMLFVDRVRPDKAALIPAVRHVDGTARVQTVGRDQHPAFHALLSAFGQRTGVPVLVNTSFNTRGEPIVCTPRDALESFCTTALDALAIGPFLLEKQAMARSGSAGP
jgi:carbamoyltransferase